MDELVKALRETDFGDTCVLCEHEDMCKGNDCIIIQAADAIEKLQKRVPKTPHGRLGDLDALARQIEHERFHHTHTDGLAALHHVTEYGHFLAVISYAPTVLEAEEGET